MKSCARAIAIYLPQFHPIPENDKWWGKGFTEWTNTAKAKPLFRGHYQPHLPTDLGFYDLRVPETRAEQAEMARSAGIEGFCYYHYWFGGTRLLERPFEEVLQSGDPDFPFCMCWANETWTGVWHGAPNKVLMEQTYPGLADHREHFKYLLSAFLDPRYITVEGKPLFVVYRPMQIPEVKRFTDCFRELAHQAGLKGIHLVGRTADPNWNPSEYGFDALNPIRFPQRKPWISKREPIKWARHRVNELRGKPTIHRYADVIPEMLPKNIPGIQTYPDVIPNWDNTPRSGKNGLVLRDSSPELFRIHLKMILDLVSKEPPEHRIVFLKSWNEWAEGNHLEPDIKFGHGYLDVLKNEICCSS
jgi:glycosyl transferase family WbsX